MDSDRRAAGAPGPPSIGAVLDSDASGGIIQWPRRRGLPADGTAVMISGDSTHQLTVCEGGGSLDFEIRRDRCPS